MARLELEDNGAGMADGMYSVLTALPEQNSTSASHSQNEETVCRNVHRISHCMGSGMCESV